MAKERKLSITISGDADKAAAAFKRAGKAADGFADDAGAAGREVGESLDDAAEEAQGFAGKLGQIGEKVSAMFRREGKASGDGFLGGMEGVGSKMGPLLMAGAAGAGVMIAGALTSAFSSAMEGAGANRKLTAQLGLTPAEAETAGRVAGEIYADAYGDSMGDVSESLGAVLASFDGLSETQLESVTKQAMDLADVFDLDVTRAVSSAGILMKSGLAKDADEAFDLLTRGMQEMPAHLREELLEASDEYGQFFAGLGFSGEKAFGILAAASADGMYGIDKTGDALKELTIRSTDMSQASQDAYAKAGLSADKMSAKFLAGGEASAQAFDELVAGLLAIEDPVERANASIALFGTPLEDLGVQEIPEFLRSLQGMEGGLGDVDGAAAALGDTLHDHAGARIETFKRKALQGLTDFIGGSVLPAAERLAEWLGPRVEEAIDKVGPKVESLGVWLAGLWEDVQPVLVTLRDELVPVIEGFVATAVERVGGLVEWWKEVWPDVQETIAVVMDGIAVVVGGVLSAIQTGWDLFGEHILSAASLVWGMISAVVDGAIKIVQGVIETAMALIRGDWGAAWDGIKTVLAGVWDTIVGVVAGGLGLMWEWLKTVAGFVWDLLAAPFNTVKDSIGGAIDGVVGFVRDLPGRIRDGLGTIFDVVSAPFRMAFNEIAKLWNRTVGQLSFSAPSWVPGIGGKGFSMPKLPEFHDGGVVPGSRGQEVLALLQAGETVRTVEQEAALRRTLSLGAFEPRSSGVDGVTSLRALADAQVLVDNRFRNLTETMVEQRSTAEGAGAGLAKFGYTMLQVAQAAEVAADAMGSALSTLTSAPTPRAAGGGAPSGGGSGRRYVSLDYARSMGWRVHEDGSIEGVTASQGIMVSGADIDAWFARTGRGWDPSRYHTGGVVRGGALGDEVLALLQVGETVRTPAQEDALAARLAGPRGSDRPLQINVTLTGAVLGDPREAGRQFVEVIDEYLSVSGRPVLSR